MKKNVLLYKLKKKILEELNDSYSLVHLDFIIAKYDDNNIFIQEKYNGWNDDIVKYSNDHPTIYNLLRKYVELTNG